MGRVRTGRRQGREGEGGDWRGRRGSLSRWGGKEGGKEMHSTVGWCVCHSHKQMYGEEKRLNSC